MVNKTNWNCSLCATKPRGLEGWDLNDKHRPYEALRGAARHSAAPIGWFERRLSFVLDTLAARQKTFSK